MAVKTTRPARKLDWKKHRPFPIKRAVGTHAYELEFLPNIKTHPAQTVLLLSPVAGDLSLYRLRLLYGSWAYDSPVHTGTARWFV